MFEFLKSIAVKAGKTPETQRQIVARALGEINAVTAGLEAKPKLSFDPASGALELDLPEQMPDETLALPAPEEAVEKAEEKAEEKAA